MRWAKIALGRGGAFLLGQGMMSKCIYYLKTIPVYMSMCVRLHVFTQDCLLRRSWLQMLTVWVVCTPCCVFAEIRALLLFWACIVCTWLWGGLHMAYSQVWMLVLFCIFNIATVSLTCYLVTRGHHYWSLQAIEIERFLEKIGVYQVK